MFIKVLSYLFLLVIYCSGQEEVPRLLCEPGDTQPVNRVNTTIRVADLRTIMQANNVAAYIVLTNDEHQSEDVAPMDQRRAYISGFSGSAGWAVITMTQQALWTDSRYYLQSDEQLDCNWILMRSGLPGVISMEDWIAEKLSTGEIVSCDSKTVPHAQWEGWVTHFNKTGELVQETPGNFVDDVWGTDRPPYPTAPAFTLDEALYTGLTWREKAQQVASKVRAAGATAHVITALDEVTWLLNIRADDMLYLPVVRSYAFLELVGTGIPTESVPTISWFVHPSKVTTEVSNFLGSGTPTAVQIFNYTDIWNQLPSLGTRSSSILLTQEFSYNLGTSHAIYSLLPSQKVKFAPPPTAQIKAQKNAVEAQGMRNAHIRDGAAVCIFLAKLEAGVKGGEIWDEISASDELARIRLTQNLSKGPSFESISASGSHAAMPHYSPTIETNSPINTTAIYKLDSGGQYLDGTTDITRTMHYGTPTADEKAMYTEVLAGQIAMATSVFPEGTKLSGLEILARGNLYKYGRDYGHGTTHGIGVYLGVHEAYNSTLLENFFGSQEPGYYEDGSYGIRLENIATVVKANFNQTTNNKQFYKFETVTLVPYEPNLIDLSLLNSEQIEWINLYHEKVIAQVRPLLVAQGEQQAIDWLDAHTQPLTITCK